MMVSILTITVLHQACYLYMFQLDFQPWPCPILSFETDSSVFLFCLSLCACFSVLGQSATSTIFEGNGFMKKSSCSALQFNIPYSPGSGASESISNVCCMRSAIVSWLLYLLGQLSVEVLFAYCGQRVVPGLNVACFSWVCSGLLVKQDLLLPPLEPKFHKSPGLRDVFSGVGGPLVGLRQV